MSAIGLRSNPTPRKQLGDTGPEPPAWRRLAFIARHSHGRAVISSISIQLDPSQTPSSRRASALFPAVGAPVVREIGRVVVHEASELRMPDELDRSNRPVAVLATISSASSAAGASS